MKLQTTSTSAVLALLSSLSAVQSLEAGDLDDMYKAFNDAFLFRDGSGASYSLNIKGETLDKGWTLARDIFAPEDVYLRRGDDESRGDINALAARFLAKDPPSSWSKDCWNDDLAWFTEMFARAHHTTGNSSYLDAAREGNDIVYARGWDTKSNDGGIWEKQPDTCPEKKPIAKQALSTIPNGMTSCYIYQSTHNATHFDRCKTTYKWTRDHLFNTTSGELYNGVLANGTVNRSKPFTDLGRWIEYANWLWLATGDEQYYIDAKRATDYGFNSAIKKDQGGVISTDSNGTTYDVAGPFGRGAGNFMRDNQLWSSYYSKFLNNADHIVKNRDPKFHITDNNWLQPNPDSGAGANLTVTEHESAVTWLSYTPPFNPSNMTVGVHTITNVYSKLILESAATYEKDQPVDLVKASNGTTQKQRWRLMPNDYKSDSSYGLVNLDSWQALTALSEKNEFSVDQNFDLRAKNQQWEIKKISNSTYSIVSKATGLALDGEDHLSAKNYTGQPCQQWYIEPLKAPKA